MIGISALAWLVLANGAVSRLEGGLLFAGLIGYLIWKFAVKEVSDDLPVDPAETAKAKSGPGLAINIGLIVIGLVLLVFGGRFLVGGATNIARALAVPEAVIGLTLVAFGTSLPELATSVVAAIRKQQDIAVGNLIGSNIFNILGILGLTALIHPIEAPTVATRDFILMMVTAFLALPFMASGLKVSRWEGGVLLSIYVGYSAWLFI